MGRLDSFGRDHLNCGLKRSHLRDAPNTGFQEGKTEENCRERRHERAELLRESSADSYDG